MIPTSAYVRFSTDGAAQVDASLHLTGSSFIHCCTYSNEPPILLVKDRHVSVSVTVPDRHKVTPADLDTTRRLVAAVAAYIAELERHVMVPGEAAKEVAA